MSFDIVIVTRQPPTRAMVEAFVQQTGWRLDLEGDLAADAGNIVGQARALFRRSKPIFVLSGPHPAEHEDLPPPVQRVIRGRALLSEMNLVWSAVGTKDAMRCFALAEHLAVTCGGAVYNPQDDALVFPDLPGKPRRSEPKLTPIRQPTLEWYFGQTDTAQARRFLELVTEVWPEARPTRFGPYEPLGHKLADPDGEDAFLDLWRDTWMFFWKARKPVFGGSLGRSPDRDEPPDERRKVQIHIDINATAIAEDPSACDRAVELFARVADELGAFFGAGFVTRGVLAGARGAQWYGSGTENFTFDWITGPWWPGLPAKTTWLSWYGRAYRRAVASALDGRAMERGSGLLVRLGSRPMDSDEVKSEALDLPADVVVGMTPQLGQVPMKDTGKPALLGYKRSPAKVIPPLV